MAEIVVVEHADGAVKDVSKCGQLQRLHLRERHEKAELAVPDIELEERPPADDLKTWKLNVFRVDMTDKHVAGDFTNVLQEAEVIRVVLNPSDFEVPVDICAVRVAIPQVLVVELAVWWHRHASISPNAYCNQGRRFLLVLR